MNTKTGNKLSFKGQIVMTSGIKGGYLTIENGYIIDVGELPLSNHIIDLEKKYIVPGFIDLHIHGIHSYLMDNGPEDFQEICRVLPQYGVTGFLPTVAPRPKGEDAEFLARLARTDTKGSSILGFHLEGPFLKITGSLTSEAISGADTSRVDALIEAAKPYRLFLAFRPTWRNRGPDPADGTR